MNDTELLRALAKARAPGAVYACVIAVRALGTDASHQAVADLTGYDRSTVSRARLLLAGLAPGWHANGSAPAEVVVPPPAPPAPAPAVPRPTPLWQRALTQQSRRVRANGERSWDLYRDLYAPAADVCIAEGGPGDLIALIADYFATVTEEPVTKTRRAQIAKLVVSHGKAALYGVREAVMADVDLDNPSALLRYARRVCERALNERRQ